MKYEKEESHASQNEEGNEQVKDRSRHGRSIYAIQNIHPYPRTKWVVRAERQFRRLWRELKKKDLQLKQLKAAEELMKGWGL